MKESAGSNEVERHLFMAVDVRAACCRVALEPPSAAGRLGCEAAPVVKSPRDPRCTGRQTFAQMQSMS